MSNAMTQATYGAGDVQDQAMNAAFELERNEKTKTPTRMTLSRRMRRLLGMLTVEPIGFFVMTSIFMTHLIVTNLILRKICLQDLNYPEETCSNLNDGNHGDEQNAVQERATQFNLVKTILEHAGPFVFTLFLGPWSDIHGRKIPMVIFLVGLMGSQLGYVVNSSFMSWSKEWILVLASLPYAFSGGTMVMNICLFSYISDISTLEARTLRVSILDVFLFGGVPVGNLLGAFLYQRLGFVRTFALAASSTFLGLLYCIFVMRGDTHRRTAGRDEGLIEEQTGALETSGNRKCRDVINLTLVKDSIQTCLKRRENRKRTVLWLLFLSILLAQTANLGELGVNYLFTRRKFNWDELQHGFYLTLNYLSDTLGCVVGVPILSYGLQLSDPAVVAVAVTIHIASRLFYAYTSSGLAFNLVSVAAVFSTVKAILGRSMITKIIPKDELGKVFAILGCIEATVPMTGGAIFNLVYAKTVADFPGAIYLVAAGFHVIVLLVYLFIYKIHLVFDMFLPPARPRWAQKLIQPFACCS